MNESTKIVADCENSSLLKMSSTLALTTVRTRRER